MFSIDAAALTTNGMTALETLVGSSLTPAIGLIFLALGLTVVFKLLGKGRKAVRRA